jgi:predicted ATPase/DNA-binding winged helix-turn-helix (wHTH) protein
MDYVSASPPVQGSIKFAGFTVDGSDRTLWLSGRRVPLGPRAFALLAYLVASRSRPVLKSELLENVWRGVVVEENNLQVQISTLRRLLGAAAIATVPGRGYRFMLPVEGDDESRTTTTDAELEGERRATVGNLPARLPPIYGRDEECAALQERLESFPLVSIVGAAGIGKTRLAVTMAARLAARYRDGVWLIELASLTDPKLLAQTIAQGMQIPLPGLGEPGAEVVAAMRDRSLLIVLDNCEHMIEEIGLLIASLLHDASQVQVLTTTQEALRVDNEQVLRLAPLPVPTDASASDAESYGAVRLFIERVRALLPRFEVEKGAMSEVVDICRRLDGLPLAIELAAARVPGLGVAGVRERLDERFRILTGGSRIAPRRHQTLRAALDWSHALLTDDERAVYRRLGLFVGSFSLEGAQQLASDDDIDEWSVLENLNSLIDKSLVLAEGTVRPRYRLLESTREHALEQLAAAGETERWMGLHAKATLESLREAIRERRTEQVLAEMGNVRIAYGWARDAGDSEAAIALATLPAMAIAVEGAVQEARERLLEVEAMLTEQTPKALAALYWQWHGRIGLGGRLPASACYHAFRRAEQLFLELGNDRHVHACRRQLAEAQLDGGDLAGARATLASAKSLEGRGWPVADVMRRLRVEGLLLAQSGDFEAALATATRALEMVERASIDRYVLVLLEDIARMHLERGAANEAAERYRALAERARSIQNAGFTRSKALAGLVAAQMEAGELQAACRTLAESLPTISRAGGVVAHADIFALLVMRLGDAPLAHRLLAASDRFRAQSGLRRDVVAQRCRDATALEAVGTLDPALEEAWRREGETMSEHDIVRRLLDCIDANPSQASAG